MNRTIILALSLAVALLAATASTASADRGLFLWCAPLPPEQIPAGCIESGDGEPSFDFGDRQVGTTSPAEGFALSGTGTDTFNPRISVSGDYAQTNTCPPTLSDTGPGQVPGADCLITVTFAPTGTGPKEGTLSTGPGGPTATLTGNGVTTPTPPVLPLRLDVSVPSPQTLNQLGRRGVVRDIDAMTEYYCLISECPRYDSTLVLRGDVKKTTTQLTTNEQTTTKARLEHLKQLKEQPTKPKIKIKFAATDEFGQTVTDEEKVTLCSRLIRDRVREKKDCLWDPSRK